MDIEEAKNKKAKAEMEIAHILEQMVLEELQIVSLHQN